jgi:hypothetical protein
MKLKFASFLLVIVFCSIIITGTSGFIGAFNVNIATKNCETNTTLTPSEHPKLALIGDPVGGGGLPCGGNKTC